MKSWTGCKKISNGSTNSTASCWKKPKPRSNRDTRSSFTRNTPTERNRPLTKPDHVRTETLMTRIERLCSNGITRSGSPKKGFRYRRADGKKPAPAELQRIHELKIPPAWSDVCINANAGGTVQA